MPKPLFIFDLDGTLMDSIGGIANSVNKTRQHLGAGPLPKDVIQSYVGHGSHNLAMRAFADLDTDKEAAFRYMVDIYAAEPVCDTFPYPGVIAGMKTLKEQGHLLAVLSNKPARVGALILQQFGLLELLDENIGGDSGLPLKPAPEAVDYIIDKLGGKKESTWMVGDNHTDLFAAANANIKSVFVTYGLGVRKDAPADLVVNSFDEFVDFVLNEYPQK